MLPVVCIGLQAERQTAKIGTSESKSEVKSEGPDVRTLGGSCALKCTSNGALSGGT